MPETALQSATASVSGASPRRTFVRPDWNDRGLVRAVAAEDYVRAIVVPAKYLVSLVSASPSLTLDGLTETLVTQARAVEVDWLRDPGTAPLVHHLAADLEVTRRLRHIPEALGLTLPFDVRRLADQGVVNEMTDRCQNAQVGSGYRAAPYFEFDSRQSPSVEWNTRFLRTMAGAGPAQPVVGFVQVTVGALRKGVLEQVVREYAGIGVSILVLRVRNLTATNASPLDLERLLAAARAFSRNGIDVLFDSLGRLGAILAAATSNAYSTGGFHFRGISGPLLSAGGGGGSSAVTYELAGGLREISPTDVRALAETSRTQATGSAAELKIRRLRAYDELASLSLTDLVARLRGGGAPFSAWAEVLLQDARRAA